MINQARHGQSISLDLVGEAVARLNAFDAAPCVVAGLSEGDSTPSSLPAIIVYPIAVDASDSAAPHAGSYQRVTMTLALVHVVSARNARGGRGDTAIDPLDALLARSRAALNGWVPDSGIRNQDALVLRRGRLVDIVDGRAIWRDEYQITWRTRCVQDS